MPCFPIKEQPKRPLSNVWSASWPCYPKDNLKCEHKCFKPVKKKDFVKANKEAIEKHRKKFLERNQEKNKKDSKLRTKASESASAVDGSEKSLRPSTSCATDLASRPITVATSSEFRPKSAVNYDTTSHKLRPKTAPIPNSKLHKSTNFEKINKEAIAEIRKKFLERTKQKKKLCKSRSFVNASLKDCKLSKAAQANRPKTMKALTRHACFGSSE